MRKAYCIYNCILIEVDRDADYCKQLGSRLRVEWGRHRPALRTIDFQLNHTFFWDVEKAENELIRRLKEKMHLRMRSFLSLKEKIEDTVNNGAEVKLIKDGLLV